jgi:hypothetical protein
MQRLAPFALGFLAAAGFGVAAAQPGAPEATPVTMVCPETLAGYTSLVCACPAAATAAGSVWGSDVYTDDSAICRAALHAGMIGAGGGRIWVRAAPGRDSYPALDRNGVASGTWGSWARSIAFAPVDQADEAALHPGPALCPENAAGRGAGETLTCSCTAEAAAAGLVWGTGPYTADSAICRAALHAGAIRGAGGVVHLTLVAGQNRYRANQRHGVTTAIWDSYPLGYRFTH